LPKNTTQCPWPGLEPKPLDPEMSAPAMRSPHLPKFFAVQENTYRADLQKKKKLKAVNYTLFHVCYHLLIINYCVVPENIHTSPMEEIFSKTPPL